MAEQAVNGEQAAADDNGQEFGIQRIYVKDVSYESPNAPKIFLEQWQPELSLDLATKVDTLEDNIYDVTLTVTATVKVGEQTAFLSEVKYAGIFMVKGFADEELKQMLGSYCPNVLYPYVRETITGLVANGGFPQLYLTPVNFDALYMQQQQEEQAAATKTDA
ncbi:MAG: protein-export chaperone SecB [Coxiellaceae bacterium]|nr:protein-export chaperone SecB [Coxiellaceae bacterium]